MSLSFSKPVVPSWFQKHSHLLTKHLGDNRAIADFVKVYSPDSFLAFDEAQEFKIIPDLSKVLHNERSLMAREIDFLPEKIGDSHKINIFDLGIPNGVNIFPLVYKLFDSGLMGTYVPVSPLIDQCQHAQRKLKVFCQHSNFPNLEYDYIVADPNFVNFKTQVVDVLNNQEEDHANLFIIALPYIGTLVHPETFLRNVYDSMPDGSYLVLLQSIYRPGTEHQLIGDFQEMSKYMKVTHNLGRLVNEQAKIETIWDDSDINPTIRMQVKVDKPVELAGVELQTGEDVKVFKHTFFNRLLLENLVRSAGFRIQDMAFDENMDNTIFLLNK
jgi:hypothetical protein